MKKKVIFAISDQGDVIELEVKDVINMEMRGKDVVYVTGHGNYRNPRSLREVEKCFASEGFKRMDRGKVFNTKAIKSIDPRHLVAKFDIEEGEYCVQISNAEIRRIKRNQSVPRSLLED
ncbi:MULTISPECIES: LytTR family transcriptional regulator DNA-binding domain-containing protein [Paenibacillus]|uniref:LytTR family transcriptional regulator DNA-binding domain-containing protein n=1 Tax=Paenibacillus TaxID=44249 RepID=UPI001BD0A565|nr:LytTR family transcriptional regulator DNA-binding domain-containing protein [Paenibacillus dendritiformis]